MSTKCLVKVTNVYLNDEEVMDDLNDYRRPMPYETLLEVDSSKDIDRQIEVYFASEFDMSEDDEITFNWEYARIANH